MRETLFKTFWRAWANALGTKDAKNPDLVAVFRTLIVVFHIIVGIVIMMNAWRHW